MRNLASKVPEEVWPEFKARVQAAYQAPSRAIARELAAGVVADYGGEHDRAVACFMDDFEACIAHLRFPVTHRRAIRTTNLLERLFVEERRRLKIIPNAFGERAVLKLMFSALIRAAERWRSVKVTEFERRQLLQSKKSSKQSRQRMMLQSDYPEILELDLGSAERQSYFFVLFCWGKPMAFNWRPTTAPVQTRYDDIWFISTQVGWGVNSAGQIVHTEDAGATWTIQHTVDADTWLRCMSFTSPTDGWVGSITRRQRLWKTEDGKTWTDMTASLPPLPSAI